MRGLLTVELKLLRDHQQPSCAFQPLPKTIASANNSHTVKSYASTGRCACVLLALNIARFMTIDDQDVGNRFVLSKAALPR
jgi:hypothetical protein